VVSLAIFVMLGLPLCALLVWIGRVWASNRAGDIVGPWRMREELRDEWEE
jgi:hypothetical protein